MIKGINVVAYIKQIIFMIFLAFVAGVLFTLLCSPLIFMTCDMLHTPYPTIWKYLEYLAKGGVGIGVFIIIAGADNGAFEYNYLMESEDDWQKTKSKIISKIRKVHHRKIKKLK